MQVVGGDPSQPLSDQAAGEARTPNSRTFLCHLALRPSCATDILPQEIDLGLRPIAPNPARGETSIWLDMSKAQTVRVSIYDLAGRQVRELVSGVVGAGAHGSRWDGRDASGRRVASGVYIARLTTAAGTQSRHFVFVR